MQYTSSALKSQVTLNYKRMIILKKKMKDLL